MHQDLLTTHGGVKVGMDFWIHNICDSNTIVVKVVENMAINSDDNDIFKS